MSWAWQPLLPGSVQLLSTPPTPPATTSGTVDRAMFAGLMRGVMFGVGGYVFLEGDTNDMIFLATQTASNSTSVDFVHGSGGVVLDSTYDVYMLTISSLVPATDATGVYIRTSTNAGSSYDSGASDYSYGNIEAYVDASVSADAGGSQGAAQIRLGQNNVGNAAGESFNAVVYLINPSNTTTYKYINYSGSFWESSDELDLFFGTGARISTSDIDAFRIIMSSGNITSGTFTLYGFKNS